MSAFYPRPVITTHWFFHFVLAVPFPVCNQFGLQ